MNKTRSFGRAAAAMLGAATLAVAAIAQADAQESEELPEELEAAIVDYMETELDGASTGMDCESAQNEGATPGDWCWEVETLGDDEAEVKFGPLQSEFMENVTFTRGDDDTWTAGSPSPEPPETGTGVAASEGPVGTTWLAGIAATMLFGAASGWTLLRRRSTTD